MKSRFPLPAGILIWVLLAVGCFLFACDQGDGVKKVDLSHRRQIQTPTELDSLTYACLPQYSHRVSFARHHLMVSYIAEKTGLAIRQVFPDTFKEHMQMVRDGKIDISFSNPLVYTRIADHYQARAFARIVEKSKSPTFRGQIICRADNKAIENLQDCKGKRWMAVDPASAAGYLFALDHFIKNGISKSDFQNISFAPGPGGKQETVVQAVYLGQADIGSIREGTLELVKDRVDLPAIRILDQTRAFPSWVYAARKDLETEVVEKIRQALLELNPENADHQKILQKAHFNAVIPAQDADFDDIRRLLEKIGENAYE
ncbi:MAG: phosphate/phosphite/phosphonate ABC transporter substrate-binding protein [Desulfobacterales bacterium]|nr:phosphate/phosphite/phosphonate ABC transporter substrate-binding protein [Desulfobacterales bacterium]